MTPDDIDVLVAILNELEESSRPGVTVEDVASGLELSKERVSEVVASLAERRYILTLGSDTRPNLRIRAVSSQIRRMFKI